MPKRTPREILEIFRCMGSCEVCENRITQALSELDAYYTLSDDELRELLPKKRHRIYDSQAVAYRCELCDVYFNDAIDACFKALQGRVPRGLTLDGIKIELGTTPILTKEGKTDTLENYIGFDNVDKIVQAIYDAQKGKIKGYTWQNVAQGLPDDDAQTERISDEQVDQKLRHK